MKFGHWLRREKKETKKMMANGSKLETIKIAVAKEKTIVIAAPTNDVSETKEETTRGWSLENGLMPAQKETKKIASAKVEKTEAAKLKEETDESTEAKGEINEIPVAKEEPINMYTEEKTNYGEPTGDQSLFPEENCFEPAQSVTKETVEAKEGTPEIAMAKVESYEIVEAKEEADDLAAKKEETIEAAELNEETNEALSKKEALAGLLKVKEEKGMEACNKLIVTRLISSQKMTVGDKSFLPEENIYVSMQRFNALDPKLGVLHDECANSAVEWCIRKMRVGHVITFYDMIVVAARLGAFNKECELMLVECAKSAAELCIKSLRFYALVDKLDKRTLLEGEITESRKVKRDMMEKLVAFKRNLTVNNVESAVTDDKFEMKECALCDEKVVVRRLSEIDITSFGRQYLRVLLEMVKGYRFGEIMEDHDVDEAMELAETWVQALYWKCVVKTCVGVLVERQSIADVLKGEVAETWRMEKEVKDKLAIYQRKQHVADIVGEKKSVVGASNKMDHRVGWDLRKVGLYVLGIRWLVVVLMLSFNVCKRKHVITEYGPWQKVILVSMLMVLMALWVLLRVVEGDGRSRIHRLVANVAGLANKAKAS